MTSRRLGVGLGLAVALAVAATVVSATALAGKEPGDRGGADAQSLRRLQGVNFVSTCRFSHRAPDDPIVSPGAPGASHDHSFVGNRTTNAFSTLDSLLGSPTSCRRAGETAAYWMPTLYVDGSPIAPLGATIYYRRRTLKRVSPFPAGFKMIAGDAKAASPQSMRVTFWNCGVAAGIRASSTPPACPAVLGSDLRLHVTFGSCWNGTQIDSLDHRSHVAYPTAGRCPAGYPVAVPAISIIYRYPVTGAHDISLASGGVYSGHADFFNAWDQGTLATLVDSCLNRLRRCGRR
jgi:hypothetical protein